MPEEKNLYKIDLFQTFLANLMNFAFMFFLLIIFAILSTQIRMLENDTNKLLGILVSIFVIVRLVKWCIMPQFCYRERSDIVFKTKNIRKKNDI